ncbi:MAG: shikimate 5-dehydrogenase, partial [Bacilli bacterium]|nr:shikimate 5-dehydrogenase [Bacilli bacterium]
MTYGLLGEKLGHSFSKDIHQRIADYEYNLIEVAKENFDNFMIERNFKAINVTIPYKELVIPYLDYIDDKAKEINAVNTIVNNEGKLIGYNTDYYGLRSLILNNNIQVNNKKALIFGTGGTSKTAAIVLKDLGAREVIKVSRNKKDDCITYQDLYYFNDID